MAYKTFDEAERAALTIDKIPPLYAVRLMDGWHIVNTKELKEIRSVSYFNKPPYLPVGVTEYRTTYNY